MNGMLAVALCLGVLCPRPAQAQRDVTTEEWREDLAYLVREMERRHADAFHTIDQLRLEAATAELDAQIPDLADHEVIVGMARLIALIGDAHTYVALPTDGPLAFHRYPVQFERLQDGVFVTRADSAHTDAIGARVVGVGAMPIEEVWDRVEPVVSRDNPMTLRYLVPFRMTIPEVLHAVGVVPELGPTDVVIERGGRLDTLQLELVQPPVAFVPSAGLGSTSDEGLFRKDPDTNYWFEPVPEHRAVYLQFNFVREDPDDPFPTFVEQLEAALAAPSVERLILDLRRNSGGGWEFAIPLFRALIRQGFDEPGRLIVLTGPATISAATVIAVELGWWLDPVYIGLPTGSSPNQYGDIVFFGLPNSDVQAGYAAALFQTAGYETAAPWLVPDVAIDVTSAEYFARRDPALQAAFTYEAGEPLGETLRRAFDAGGLEASLAAYDRYRTDRRHAYLDTERTLRHFGDCLVEEERIDDALGVHRHNVAVHPDRSRAYYGLAEALTAAGRPDDARHTFEMALRHVPDDPSLYSALAIVIESAIRQELE